ncbi:MAG: Rrf2 family transcriptional regulator [Anaerolineales bacterium]|nr:Rrf2 family transcriptional regulator [Anaerolineales bacterium]
MQITRQADYAVRAIVYLAQQGSGARVSTAQVAQEQHIPPTFLAKIISQLSTAGVVRATRGARGGITLARPPEEISLLEIVEAIDGPVSLNECTHDPSLCLMGETCAVREVWCDVRVELVGRLKRTTFDQLTRPVNVSAPELMDAVAR